MGGGRLRPSAAAVRQRPDRAQGGEAGAQLLGLRRRLPQHALAGARMHPGRAHGRIRRCRAELVVQFT